MDCVSTDEFLRLRGTCKGAFVYSFQFYRLFAAGSGTLACRLCLGLQFLVLRSRFSVASGLAGSRLGWRSNARNVAENVVV